MAVSPYFPVSPWQHRTYQQKFDQSFETDKALFENLYLRKYDTLLEFVALIEIQKT